MIEESASTQERKLYEALVSLEEGGDLAELAAKQAAPEERERFRADAKQLREYSLTIRRLLEGKRALTSKTGGFGNGDSAESVEVAENDSE